MQQKSITKEEYSKRINTVIEYIANNLDKEMELSVLSEISNFSPYHFHRIFRAIVGEPIGAFIVRLRVETAARLLRYSSMPVQDIAYSVGYSVPSSLTKVFRQFYDISPTDYRNNKNYVIMKPLQLATDTDMKAPKIVETEPKQAIYVRLTGDYKTIDYCGAFTKLWAYVKENKLYTAGIEHISISQDDPHVTETEKLRTDVCLTIHKPVEPKGEIGVKEIPGGKFAVFTFTGPYENLDKAFDTIYRKYLPESEYELRMEQSFEIYKNNPDNTPPEKLKTEIYIPVK